MDVMEKKKPHKGVYLLPNMITTLSMFLGFLSMVWAVQGRFEEAGMAILVSALMDGLDGKVARLTNTASEFGVQYDSLADLVAFGLAPAMLLWQWQLQAFGRLGVAAAGGSGGLMAAAETYAQELGLAFQIRDDMLDVTGTTEEFGKPVSYTHLTLPTKA